MRAVLLAAFFVNGCVLLGALVKAPIAKQNAAIQTQGLRHAIEMIGPDGLMFPSHRTAILGMLDNLEQWARRTINENDKREAVLFLLGGCDFIVFGFLYFSLIGRKGDSTN